MVQYFSKCLDKRDTGKIYSIKLYGLQMKNANTPKNFYGYLKARENVIALLQCSCQVPETRPLHTLS